MTETNQTSGDQGKLPMEVGNVDASGVSHLNTKEATPKSLEARTEPENVGDTKAQETKSTPKTYTEEDLNQRIATVKGGHEGTVKQMRAEMAKLKEQITTAQQAAEEARQNAWLDAIRESGGDVNVAQKVIERDKVVRATEARQMAREAELSEKEAMLNEAGRTKSALDMVSQYGLDRAVVDELLKASDPRDMEIKALKLHAEKLKTSARPSESPDKGQSGKGLDISKMSIRERLGAAAEGRI